MNKWGTIIGLVVAAAVAGALVYFSSEYRRLIDENEKLKEDVKLWQEKQDTCNRGMQSSLAECQKKQDNLRVTYEEKLKNRDTYWQGLMANAEKCCRDHCNKPNGPGAGALDCPTPESQKEDMDQYNAKVKRRK